MAVQPDRARGSDLPLAFKTLRTTRWHMVRELDGLSHDQLLAIPEGRDDNILWNVGHLLCSLSRLTYVFSGYPLPIPQAYLSLFGKGTNAVSWESPPDPEEVLQRFLEMPDKIEADYRAGKFGDYKPLTLGGGHTVQSVEEAVAFHCFHEGLHIGMVISLKRMLGLTTSE